MSLYDALGGVSASLQLLLQDRMDVPQGVGSPPVVTVGTPRAKREEELATAEDAGVNLFLYRVTENPFLRNQEIPTRRSPSGYGHPPLSLDLHYVLTGYGTKWDASFPNDTLAQFMLGSAMRVLHDYSVITDDLQTTRVLPQRQILHVSLRNEFEKVKVNLEPFSLEEISKVWTALTLPYRLSAPYQVSVVQIDSHIARSFPKPVGEPPKGGPRVHALPFQSPQTDGIHVVRFDDATGTEGAFPFARVGDRLVITGRNLGGSGARVFIGDVDVTAGVVPPARTDRVEVVIPDDVALQPGPQLLKITLTVLMGEPPQSHVGLESNLASFMLVPHIGSLTPDPVAVGGTLTVNGTRLFRTGMDGQTLIGDTIIGANHYTAASPTSIAFALPAAIVAGPYPVRVRLNGSETIEAAVVHVQ